MPLNKSERESLTPVSEGLVLAIANETEVIVGKGRKAPGVMQEALAKRDALQAWLVVVNNLLRTRGE